MRKTCHIRGLYVLAVFFFAANLSFADEIGFSSPRDDGYWQICIMNLNDGTIRQITKSHRDKKEFAWFGKEQKFVCRTGNARFYLFNIRSGEETRLLEKYGNLFDPDISPDHRYLLFTRFRTDMPDNSDIWQFDLSTKKAKRLVSGAGLQYDPAWSADGEKIAYVSSDEDGHNIRVMNRDGGNQIVLTGNTSYNVSPDWSLDGEKIVFASNVEGNYDIWVMDHNGQNKKRLTNDKGLDIQPAWSSDGEKILFVSNRQGNLQIWMMKADGSDQKPLTPDKIRCSDPGWVNVR